MASKKLPSSKGYFNKEMLAILKQGEQGSAKKKSESTKGKSAKKK